MIFKKVKNAPNSADSAPFLPLEESGKLNISKSESSFGDNIDEKMKEDDVIKSSTKCIQLVSKTSGKKVILTIFGLCLCVTLWESFFLDPQDRLIQPDFSDKFLIWVQSHPGYGLWAISLVIAAGVVTMVPVGTPLTLGCGYIYRGVYGWKLGVFVATVVSMSGSCLGAVMCFLIGRYLMRDTVKKWARKYPLFDAIDVAASEQGLKIMAMLYLTPVLPLGLVSYMCGTTSMSIISFVGAKIAALPLYILYTFIGASAHSLIKRGGNNRSVTAALAETKQMEENQVMIVVGLVLSIVMMTLITRHIRKELMKILEQQKGKAEADDVGYSDPSFDDNAVEIGLVARRRGHK